MSRHPWASAAGVIAEFQRGRELELEGLMRRRRRLKRPI